MNATNIAAVSEDNHKVMMPEVRVEEILGSSPGRDCFSHVLDMIPSYSQDLWRYTNENLRPKIQVLNMICTAT